MKTLFTSVCLLLAFFSQAQLHFGATTAVNSSFVLDKGLSEDPRYNSTFTYEFAPVGFAFGVDIGKRFGLQLESIIANQGQIFEVVDAAKEVVGERNIDLSYVQVPLFMKFMSGKDKGARTNFSFGPQLSILRSGVETIQYSQSVMAIADEFVQDNGDGTYTVTDPSTGEVLDAEATLGSAAGTYNVSELPTTEVLSDKAEQELQKFRNKEFQIAASFGLDIDLGKHLYLSSLIRANYSLTDMRNGEIIDQLKENGVEDLFERRANLLVGVQLGLHYVIGGTRSWKSKQPLTSASKD